MPEPAVQVITVRTSATRFPLVAGPLLAIDVVVELVVFTAYVAGRPAAVLALFDIYPDFPDGLGGPAATAAAPWDPDPDDDPLEEGVETADECQAPPRRSRYAGWPACHDGPYSHWLRRRAGPRLSRRPGPPPQPSVIGDLLADLWEGRPHKHLPCCARR